MPRSKSETTEKIIRELQEFPNATNKELAEKYKCTSENISNIRRRYNSTINERSRDVYRSEKIPQKKKINNLEVGSKCKLRMEGKRDRSVYNQAEIYRTIYILLTGKSTRMNKEEIKKSLILILKGEKP